MLAGPPTAAQAQSDNAQTTATESNTNETLPRANRFDRALQFSNGGQRMTLYLEQLRNRFRNAAGIAEREKENFITSLNEDISYLQSEAISIGKARTDEDLDARRERLREYWLTHERRVKFLAGALLSSHVRFTIERMEGLQPKAAELIKRLTDEGDENVDVLKDAYDTFTSYVTAARTEYDEARTSFQQIETSDDPQALFVAGHDHLKAAHESLRMARKTFKELLVSLRKALPPTENATTTQSDYNQ